MKKKSVISKKTKSVKVQKVVKSIKKKPVVKKPAIQKKAANTKLISQLQTMIKDLNEHGLKILITQAQVLLHNMKVVESINERKKNPEKIKDKGIISNKTSIDVKEAEDNSYFIIIINGARLFFSLEQMKMLVKICHSSGNEKEGSFHLYNWFSKNRRDVLDDAKIYGAADQALATIYKFIISKYAVKK